MKIIHFITSLSSGGAEKMVVDLANQQSSMGEDVTVCILLDDSLPDKIFNRQFLNGDVKFHSLKVKNGLSLLGIFRSFLYFWKEKPDILHCHLNILIYVYLFAILSRGTKTFTTLHSVAHRTVYKHFFLQKYINKFFFKANIIKPVTISNQCHDSYVKFYGLSNDITILNGRSQSEPTEQFSEVKSEIDRYKINNKTIVYVHVGRCDEVKNHDLLIDSFNKIVDSDLNAILLIIGAGFDSHKGNVLRKKSSKNIYFLGEKNNIGDYLACSNIFCLSSKYEGISLSLLEALSVGLTCVCTPVGGNVDVIKEGFGYLSSDQDVESYSRTLCFAFTHLIDPTLVKDYYKSSFSIHKCAEEYIKVYQ